MVLRHRAPAAEGDAESAGGPGAGGEGAGRVVGDAGLVLRDPSTAHLLAHQARAPEGTRRRLPPPRVTCSAQLPCALQISAVSS